MMPATPTTRKGMSGAMKRVFVDPFDYLSTPLISDREISLGRGQKCWRWTLIVLSLAFIAFGIVTIYFGTSALTRSRSSSSTHGRPVDIPVGMIVAGSFTLLFSVCGIIGSYKESSKLLWIYLICNTLAAIALMIVSVMVLTAKGPDVQGDWQSGRWDDTRKMAVQTRANCCGLNTFDDAFAIQPCPATATEACAPLIASHVTSFFNLAGSIGVGLSCVMISTLVSTMVLAIAFTKKHTYSRIKMIEETSDLGLGMPL